MPIIILIPVYNIDCIVYPNTTDVRKKQKYVGTLHLCILIISKASTQVQFEHVSELLKKREPFLK